MSNMKAFNQVQVDSRLAVSLEDLGTKRKFWYYDDDSRHMLFKAEERGTGDDWAEKVACELCELLGLPHVHYQLAVDVAEDVPGVVCETCAPPPMAMGLGNQLLQDRDPKYPEGRKYKVREHTVDAVAEVVKNLELPPQPYCKVLPSGIESALAVFTGYIMLDAWIANQDRHHENWAALCDRKGLYLAPTFDHGASMARNLTDAERGKRLASKDKGYQMPAFVRRADSAFYADAGKLSTLEAWRAFSQRTPQAAMIWLERLGLMEDAAVEEVLKKVPSYRMSEVCRKFTLELLRENRRRLLMKASEE